MIRVAGHRGAAGRAPENTRASFRLAWELGADMVELDVRLTADGHPVTLHDATLDRTTNGAGPVAARTLAEIRTLDAGARRRDPRSAWVPAPPRSPGRLGGWRAPGPSFAGERVPTLEEGLGTNPSLVINPSPDPSPKRRGELEPRSGGAAGDAGSTRWLVELKQGGGLGGNRCPPARLVERVLEAIEAAGAGRTVRLISFEEALLEEARRQAPAIPRGIISSRDPAFLLAVAERLACVAIHPAGTILTPELVAAAHTAGWLVNTWTLNNADPIRDAARLGVDEITSDFPDVAIAALSELGLR